MNMNMPVSNAPIPSSGGSKSFFQVWIDALTKPNENTFVEIASSPNAKAMTAYLWVFVGFLVEFFFRALVSGTVARSYLEKFGLGNQFSGGIVSTIIRVVCGAPIAAVIFTIFFAIGTAIILWIAKMFGGKGTNDQLAYAFAAFSVPLSFVRGVLALFVAIPYVGTCFGILGILITLYALALAIIATKGVNQFGWGQAAGSVLIPFAALLLVCCCVLGVGFFAMGATFKNLFQQLQQNGLGS